MLNTKVEVGQYKAMNKGALKGFFSLCIDDNIQFLGCSYFIKNGRAWFKFPEKEGKSKDGEKTEYFPIIKMLNRDYLADLNTKVLDALLALDTNENVPF
jgi:hypothetical protein